MTEPGQTLGEIVAVTDNSEQVHIGHFSPGIKVTTGIDGGMHRAAMHGFVKHPDEGVGTVDSVVDGQGHVITGGRVEGDAVAHPQIGHRHGGTTEVGYDPDGHPPHTVAGQVTAHGVDVGVGVGAVLEQPQIGHWHAGIIEVAIIPDGHPPHSVVAQLGRMLQLVGLGTGRCVVRIEKGIKVAVCKEVEAHARIGP